jgi:GNAT superfamily N-acetyltransferase
MTLSIRTAALSDLDTLQELAEAGNDAPYRLPAVISEKCFDSGPGGEPRTRIALQGRTPAGFAVTCGNALRLLVVAHGERRQGVGTALLKDAEEEIGKGGASRVIVAAEAGNYFTPGVVTSDMATLEFFAQRGFAQRSVTDNLETALTKNELLDPARAEGTRRARPDEKDRVLAFIEREFGAIWRFECTPAFSPDLPNMFISEQDGQITGFAAHDANNRGLGFFGPTGVMESRRGRGTGRALVVASLLDLSRLGHDRAIIPWTDALEFYRKSCGARVGHRFIAIEKNLER